MKKSITQRFSDFTAWGVGAGIDLVSYCGGFYAGFMDGKGIPLDNETKYALLAAPTAVEGAISATVLSLTYGAKKMAEHVISNPFGTWSTSFLRGFGGREFYQIGRRTESRERDLRSADRAREKLEEIIPNKTTIATRTGRVMLSRGTKTGLAYVLGNVVGNASRIAA